MNYKLIFYYYKYYYLLKTLFKKKEKKKEVFFHVLSKITAKVNLNTLLISLRICFQL